MDTSLPDCLRICGHRVWVAFQALPIETRAYDWVAGLVDGDEYGPNGFGATKLEALEDLRERLTEEA
jgi:hypothetical protein